MHKVCLLSSHPNTQALRKMIYFDHYRKLRSANMLESWSRTFVAEYERFTSALEGSRGDALIVVLEGSVLGYLVYSVNEVVNGTTAHIIAFRVKPERRRSGMGRSLLTECQQLAQEHSWARLIVEVGSGQSAEAARRLYAQQGFSITSLVMECITEHIHGDRRIAA